jgi:cell division protein FtsW (lipid II flippase)
MNADKEKPYHGLTRINADQDRGDILRPMNRRYQRPQSGVAKAPVILLLLAVAIFAAGAARYYRHGNFSLAQAGYCVVAILASLVVLLVFDYTLHHAKLAAVMVLIFVVLFLVASPAFCVGMGLGLAGMVVVQGGR